MANVNKLNNLPADVFIILEGVSAKDGKPYSFAKLKSEIGNSPDFVSKLKEAGVPIGVERENVVINFSSAPAEDQA